MMKIFRIIKKYCFDYYYYYAPFLLAFKSTGVMLAFVVYFANIIMNIICVCCAGLWVYNYIINEGGYFRNLLEKQSIKLKRIHSFCLDVVVINFILMLISTILNLCNCEWSYYTLTLIVPLYLFKDNFTGQSIGQAIIGISTVHNDTAVRPVRALVRNLFLLIWPIELLLFLFSGKRLGDIVTKTETVVVNERQRPTNGMLSVILFMIVWGAEVYCFWRFCASEVALLIPYTA